MASVDGAIFRGVFEAAPDAVLIVDRAGQVVLANAQCRTVFGCEPADLEGVDLDELVPNRLREADSRAMGLLRQAAVRRDGTEFPAEISLAPIDVAGSHYISATVRDITARTREEERFRNLLEAAPDPTVIVDEAGIIVLANDRVHTAFGHAREELVGKGLDVLAREHERAETIEGYLRYVAAPSELVMGSLRQVVVRHRDGHDVPVELSMSPLQTAEGLVVSVALRDVSERLRIEAASQGQRDALIATVSHELRTPLASIIGYTELLGDLADEDLSRRARKLLGVIERNAMRELQLVDDLLTMAYLDADRVHLVLAPVDVAQVCLRVVADLGLRARERGLTLVVVDEDDAPQVHGDQGRLVQVVENLVGNALKFTRPGGRIELSARAQGAMGLIEVRDTGIGVVPEEKARIFDRLYRAREAVELQTQGAGLGLSIVRAIVEGHGGWVDLESEVGVGTVVRVAIPLTAPAE